VNLFEIVRQSFYSCPQSQEKAMQTAMLQQQADAPSQTQLTLLDRVLAYENPELVERIKDKQSLSEEKADALFEDLKRFLYLCGNSPAHHSPPRNIDSAWHQFILYTRDYAVFCEEMFGRFIHHKPASYFRPKTQGGVQRTIEAAGSQFGALSGNWKHEASHDDCEEDVRNDCEED
jgi:hypothetical protein